MMKTVVITGVTGQDGSYMVDYLLANTEYRVVGIVRRSSCPNYQNISHVLYNDRFKVRLADLTDYNSIEQIVKEEKPDYFINFGAQSFVGASWDIPEQTFDIVAGGVLRCLQAIRKHAPQCHFYSAGSSEEMGDVLYSPQDKAHPIRPRSPYGAAKAAARHLVKVYRESYNLYAVHGILYNHESPRRGPEFVTRKITLGVAKIYNALKTGQKVEPIELGNLDAKRDWSHAEDFVEGVWLMLNQDKSPQEYILSSNETHTVREFIEKAFDAADIPHVWRHGFSNDPKDEHLLLGDPRRNGLTTKLAVPLVVINPKFYRPAEVSILLGDSSPARTELGWKPKHSFDSLVKDMVQSDINALTKYQEKIIVSK